MEAMRVVVKKYPKAKLAIVGYGPMENKLEDMIQKYGFRKNVYLVNKNTLYFDKDPKDAKVKLMQQAWALLLPSVKKGGGHGGDGSGCVQYTINCHVSYGDL